MYLFDMLIRWLLCSFYRLWQPAIAAIGFNNPATLAFITLHNILSISYLWLITAVGYLIWQRRGWVLPFIISLTWILIGLLFFGACWERYGFTPALAAIFTHGWLELSAIFYWIHCLRKACLKCYVPFENRWSSWTDWFSSLWTPTKLFHIIEKDIKKAWGLMGRVLNVLWSQKIRRDFLLVLLLIFASAFIETYITPNTALSLSS